MMLQRLYLVFHCRRYLMVQSSLLDLTKKELYKRTQCTVPCTYYHYQVVSKVPGDAGYGTNCQVVN